MTEINDRQDRRRFPRWLLILLISVFALVLLVGAGVWYIYSTNEYCVELTLLGEAEMVLDYGEQYEEPGAEAFGYGTLLKTVRTPCAVTISGEVDPEKLGTYILEYRAGFEDAQGSVSRKVTIVDREAPTIVLQENPEHFTFPGQPYEEEGFMAEDNYDGDLTQNVSSEERDGKVIYRVADTSGNECEVVREIYYADPVPPELTLKGDLKITITAGDSWSDPGFEAVDNVDGDLTANVTVEGEVITDKAGTYRLIYQVVDGYGNVSSAQRDITVKAKPVTSDENVIYLTFDDGPGPHTARLLEILDQYQVKATFFVCNTGYVDLFDDMVNAGHTVAIHTYSHNYSKIYTGEDAFYKDLYAMQDVIFNQTGIKATVTRFPGGSSNSISKRYCVGIMSQLSRSLQQKGFYYFDWNVDSDDAGSTKTTEGVVQNVIGGISRRTGKNHYVLQHDIYDFSVDAVEQIIQWGLENGYVFKAITPDSPTCHHGISN